jgi:hypothetical protein
MIRTVKRIRRFTAVELLPAVGGDVVRSFITLPSFPVALPKGLSLPKGFENVPPANAGGTDLITAIEVVL